MNGGKKFWIGFGVSALLLALFFLTVDLGRMLDAIAGADYVYVAPAAGLYLVAVLFRTLRWQKLLRHMRVVTVARLYPVVVVGYMANNLLPLRLGELVRSYYVSEREGISKTSALVTIFVERLLDALTLLLFIAVIAVFIPVLGVAEAFGERYGVSWQLLVAALSVPFVAAFGALLLMAFSPTNARVVGVALVRPLPEGLGARLINLLDLALAGLVPLRSPSSISGLFALSMPIWLLEAGLFFLIGLSFGLHEIYDNLWEMAIAIVLVTAVANIGSSVPAAPGGIGLFELVARETLVLLPLAAVDRSVAAGYVAVVHATLLLPMIVLGQVFLWVQQVSLGTLSRAGRSAAAGPGPVGGAVPLAADAAAEHPDGGQSE